MATLTVGRLHKILGEMVADGRARRPICINKDSFWHPLESDGVVILDVTEVKEQCVIQSDDDGGAKTNKDGTESLRQCVVLGGGYEVPLIAESGTEPPAPPAK